MTSVKYVLLLPICAILACAESTTAPSNAVLAKSKPADAVLVNEKFDQVFDLTNPCNGEQVIGTATYQVFVSTVDTKSGNSSAKNSTKIDFTGVGVATGVQYNGSITDSFNYSLGTERAVEVSTESRMKVNSKNNKLAQDFTSTVRVHVTINANGVPTADQEIVTSECK